MSAALRYDRTDWRSSGSGLELIDREPAPRILVDDYATGLPSRSVIVGLMGVGGLLANALIATLTQQVTAAPATVWPIGSVAAISKGNPTETAAQHLGNELRQISGLTNEEIAPLLGISRRSFQTWLAGGAISARKEERLRLVVEAVRHINTTSADDTRTKLLNRDIRSVRPYDLLAEGRFEAAINLATGQRVGTVRTKPADAETILEQLDRDQGTLPDGPVRLNRRLSGPLRR